MYVDKTGRRNASGLPDPTAKRGIDRAERSAAESRAERCRNAMRAVAHMDGFEVVSPIRLREIGGGAR